MSAEHNHPPRCCCPLFPDTSRPEPGHWLAQPGHECPGCPEHGALAVAGDPGDPWHWSDGTPVDQAELEAAATPYTEQETTNG